MIIYAIFSAVDHKGSVDAAERISEKGQGSEEKMGCNVLYQIARQLSQEHCEPLFYEQKMPGQSLLSEQPIFLRPFLHYKLALKLFAFDLLIILLIHMMLSQKWCSFLIKRSFPLPPCFSTATESYQSRKEIKRLQKTNDSFKIEHKLVETQLNAQFLVPNFFTSTLTLCKFQRINMSSPASNSFLNSYSSLYLPLAANPKLREKLNKLYDNQVRTGRIFEIMDSVAGLVSYRHCYGKLDGQEKNKMVCVTGSIESFFIFEKIDIKKDLAVEGYLNAVGKTSMEVEIHVKQEEKIKASSIFTMIARDAENMAKGYTVPSLDFSHLNESERGKAVQREAAAKQNALRRKKQIENSYDKKPPTQTEIDELHQLFLNRKEGLLSRSNSTPIAHTVIQNCEIMHTQERNVHGKIFGGFLVREMVELGWVAACKYAQDYVIMQDFTNIYFKRPVDVGSRLTLKSSITFVQGNRLVITVEAYTAKFTDKKETLACVLNLIAKASKIVRKVHPESYEEGLQYLTSKHAYFDLFY